MASKNTELWEDFKLSIGELYETSKKRYKVYKKKKKVRKKAVQFADEIYKIIIEEL